MQYNYKHYYHKKRNNKKDKQVMMHLNVNYIMEQVMIKMFPMHLTDTEVIIAISVKLACFVRWKTYV